MPRAAKKASSWRRRLRNGELCPYIVPELWGALAPFRIVNSCWIFLVVGPCFFFLWIVIGCSCLRVGGAPVPSPFSESVTAVFSRPGFPLVDSSSTLRILPFLPSVPAPVNVICAIAPFSLVPPSSSSFLFPLSSDNVSLALDFQWGQHIHLASVLRFMLGFVNVSNLPFLHSFLKSLDSMGSEGIALAL